MSSSNSEQHIINQNKKLISENSQLNNIIHQLTEKIKNTEEELDTRETQVTYMRGLLKNLICIQKSYENLFCNYKNLDKHKTELSRNLFKYNKILFEKVYILLIVIGPWILSLLTTETWAMIFLLITGIVTLWINCASIVSLRTATIKTSDFSKRIILKENENIKRSREELDNTIQSSDLLNSYIDNI